MKTPYLIATLFAITTILSCSKKSEESIASITTTNPEAEFVVDSTSRANGTGSVTTEELVKLVVLAQGGIGIEGYEKLTSSTSFIYDLGYGSLEYMEFIMEIERFFLLQIPDEDSEKLTTIGAMVRYLDERSMGSPTVWDIFPPGSGGSGGSGGGNEGECKYNEMVASASKKSDKIRVEICGTGPNSRTKCYYWKIYSISSGMIPMYFVSKEQAIQSNRGGNVWQFESFDHKEITKAGYEILYSASINNVVPTSSLKKSGLITYNDMAQMHLSFTASASAVCEGLPMVFNDPTSTQQTWNASE